MKTLLESLVKFFLLRAHSKYRMMRFSTDPFLEIPLERRLLANSNAIHFLG